MQNRGRALEPDVHGVSHLRGSAVIGSKLLRSPGPLCLNLPLRFLLMVGPVLSCHPSPLLSPSRRDPVPSTLAAVFSSHHPAAQLASLGSAGRRAVTCAGLALHTACSYCPPPWAHTLRSVLQRSSPSLKTPNEMGVTSTPRFHPSISQHVWLPPPSPPPPSCSLSSSLLPQTPPPAPRPCTRL